MTRKQMLPALIVLMILSALALPGITKGQEGCDIPRTRWSHHRRR